MNILGINYFFHDATACLVADGKIVAAVEEERLNRQKHTAVFPERSIARCLAMAGLSFADIDHVAVSIKPSKDWPAKTLYGLKHLRHAKPFVRHELVRSCSRQHDFWRWYRSQACAERQPPVHFVPHHLSHAVGSFLVSPFEHAALLSLDGSGEWATAFIGEGQGTRISCFNECFFPHSLGSFYEAATEFCGFRPNYDEGKTMGLAPFGDRAVFSRVVSDIARVRDDGRLWVDLSYFGYQYWGWQRCGPKFYQAFGQPRQRGEEFADRHLHVAAAFQHVLEERALDLCHQLRERSRARHLVIAGGVALNSVMNGRLLREAGFDDIYVMPAAGDNGTAIGAAFYVYHVVLGQPRQYVHEDPYLGPEYGDTELARLLKECKVPVRREPDIVATAAKLLADGNILGWLQGRMEIGPRALGNRSILANPTLAHMKDKINAEVKHREAFRPFAPSVPVEDKNRYFDAKGDSPFMLKVCDVLPSMRGTLPAITHVDGTARLQTVAPHINGRYHALLRRFGEHTGVPVLLNTSFNIQGEPIVETPVDAIRCFFSTGLDYLVLGDYLVAKNPA